MRVIHGPAGDFRSTQRQGGIQTIPRGSPRRVAYVLVASLLAANTGLAQGPGPTLDDSVEFRTADGLTLLQPASMFGDGNEGASNIFSHTVPAGTTSREIQFLEGDQKDPLGDPVVSDHLFMVVANNTATFSFFSDTTFPGLPESGLPFDRGPFVASTPEVAGPMDVTGLLFPGTAATDVPFRVLVRSDPPEAVPEPRSLVILGIGTAALAACARRRTGGRGQAGGAG